MSFVGDAFDAITGQDARNAAGAQAQSGQQAMDIVRDMSEQARQDVAPWRSVGQNALFQLSDTFGLGGREQFEQEQRREQLMSDLFNVNLAGEGNERRRRLEQLGVSSPDATVDFSTLTQENPDHPYVQGGGQAIKQGEGRVGEIINELATIDQGQQQQGQQDFSDFYQSPGYQFRLDQGTEAIERSNAASGMLNSGATLQDLEQFGQGVASQEFNNYVNQLMGLSGAGQGAASQQGQIAANQGNQLANLQTGIGNARASGYVGQGNAIRSLLGQGAQAIGTAVSDRRLKRDIARVGTLESGIPVYHFRYNWSDDWYEGVMADEVEPIIPEAVTEIDGYKAVDYAKVH